LVIIESGSFPGFQRNLKLSNMFGKKDERYDSKMCFFMQD
jgi:hypothetical protein